MEKKANDAHFEESEVMTDGEKSAETAILGGRTG